MSESHNVLEEHLGTRGSPPWKMPRSSLAKVMISRLMNSAGVTLGPILRYRVPVEVKQLYDQGRGKPFALVGTNLMLTHIVPGSYIYIGMP